MKFLLISLTFLTGCFSPTNTYRLSSSQEADLEFIISELEKIEFKGSIVIDSKEIRDRSVDVINVSLPDSIYRAASRYSFKRIVIEPEFTYFVMDGFKGSNYGLLLTDVKEEKINGFYNVQFIRSSTTAPTNTWYFVSSKLY